jgi:hypothetical protein
VDVDLLLDSFLPPPNSKTIYGSCSKFLKSKTNPSHVTCSLFNSLIGNLVPSTTFVKCEIVGKSSSNFCWLQSPLGYTSLESASLLGIMWVTSIVLNVTSCVPHLVAPKLKSI